MMTVNWRGEGRGMAAACAGRRAERGRTSLFLAGLVLGGLVSLIVGDRLSAARLDAWLGAASAKDSERLAATAEHEVSPDLAGTCTALVLDRFTGLTAALACAEAPAMPSPIALRHGEIES